MRVKSKNLDFEQYVGRGSERGNKHIGRGMPQIKLIFFNVLF